MMSNDDDTHERSTDGRMLARVTAMPFGANTDAFSHTLRRNWMKWR